MARMAIRIFSENYELPYDRTSDFKWWHFEHTDMQLVQLLLITAVYIPFSVGISFTILSFFMFILMQLYQNSLE